MKNIIIENLFGFLMSISFIVCFFPQLRLLLKNKNSENISLFTYYIILFGYVCSIIYWYLSFSGIWMLIGTLICLILCCVNLYLIIKYKK